MKIRILKQLLNEILNLTPPLLINDKYDKLTKQAVKHFETKYQISPADNELDEATWIRLGEVAGAKLLEQIIKQSNYDRELIKLFGLKPNSAVIEKNNYPSFSKDDQGRVDEGLRLAYELVGASGGKKDKVLSGKGVASVRALLDDVITSGAKANTFDGRESALLITFNLSGKPKTRSINQFFQDHKSEVGALVTNAGGKKVMFIGHFYFDNVGGGSAQRRAFIIMHESVHLIGNLRDIDFGTPQPVGSRNLSKILVDEMFPALNALEDKYRGVL